ncbi:S41 family peptidase [Bradyrhizobium archetypum]|jgi:carboxyl-terminal processing protease|uniref:S41 family peptidase n=1 Tax=Bradyrhizobium archetypum TaxID=2721160 RepID=A0A7Y4H8D2_9BRAD|nr:S41 family peptidase [Bradyrhizobium archetypum]NOJ49533.1 S41 family peptidase [Bradyrhizobium archetypum]
MRRNFAFLLGTVTGACLTAAVIGPQGAHLVAAAKAAARSDTYTQLNLFGTVFERIKTSYVEKPDDSKLMEGAINGMISALDPHSRYMNEKGWSDMQETTHGEFGGLGIEVTMEDGLVKVVTPIDDTPAAKAGILSGDVITQIDDEVIQGMSLEQAVSRMKGPANSKIRLKVMRKGAAAPIDVAIMREIIRVRPVRFKAEGGDIGYIRITRFNEQTTDGLKKAIASISKEIPPEKLAGYVVDLRNNPGGLLDQAVSVSSAFMNRGEVVSTRGRTAEETQRFSARGGDITKGKPLVVLINGGSASASEIVAGALRDHKRATLIGTRTFGKGSVQTIIPLGQGNGALALTTARYFTPSGRSIQAQGIAPDVEVLQEVPDEFKGRAELKGEASMRGHLAADGAEQTGSQAYVPPNEKDDKALNAAFNLLRGVTVNANGPAMAKRAVPN